MSDDPVSPETAERADATLEELRRERDEARAELERVKSIATGAIDAGQLAVKLARNSDGVWLSREDADMVEAALLGLCSKESQYEEALARLRAARERTA